MIKENSATPSFNSDKHKIGKILIAVDKAGYREKIITYGIILAKGTGATVTAIHVLDESTLEGIGDFFGTRVNEYQKALKNHSEESLTDVREILEKEGIKTNTEVISSKSVAQGIIDYAKKSEADVIVIGTKDLGYRYAHLWEA